MKTLTLLLLILMTTEVQIRAAAELELRKREEEKLKNYSSRMLSYQADPFSYLVERLDIKPETVDWSLLPEYKNHIWDGTPNPFLQILNYLTNREWVGVESAKGVGKTFFGAGIVYWFLECFENSLVITTAPKKEQLSLHIWKEIGRLHAKFGRGDLTTLKLRMNPSKDDWIAVGYIAGVEASEIETSAKKAQGFHAEHMLIILEETPGIKEPIMTALQDTCSAPHNLILALGNPDHQFDTLHRFCSLPNVKSVRISGKDHPNVVLDKPDFIPGATSREDISRKLFRYKGEDNPLFLASVRGISPSQSADSLIRLEWCYAARDRRKKCEDSNGRVIEELIKGLPALGVDVANSEDGDKAAIAEGKGAVLIQVEDFQCPDSNQLGKRDVLRRMKDKKISDEYVGIDGIGVGAGTVNALKEMGRKVTSIIASASPITVRTKSEQGKIIEQEEDFNNLRSQMWWQFREDLRTDPELCLPDDPELFADLVTPKWTTQNGKIVIESKETIKKRLGRSPNKADAVILWNLVRKGLINKKSKLKSSII